MNPPKISIGVPVYNGEKFLAQALDSLLAQTFDDFEIVVCDNASTDRTAAICQAYAAKDRRIRYCRNETNIGSAPNYEKVFQLARGEFFKWHAHDDVLMPGFLQRCHEVMRTAPSSLVLVYPRCEMIDENGKVLHAMPSSVETRHPRPHRRLAHVLRWLSYAYPIWGLIRTEVLRKTRLTGAVYYWDDSLMAEVALYGEIREIPEVLSQQRCHRGNALELISTQQGEQEHHNPTKANRKTRQAMLAWTNPKNAGKKVWLPNWEERCLEYLKRVYHAPLPLGEKALCYGTVVAVCYWRRFVTFVGYWRRKLTGRLQPSTPGANPSNSVSACEN